MELILANIHQYQFQQALWLLETEYRVQPKLITANQVSFPGADISSALINKQQQVELWLNFMGLYGVDSPLPHYFIDLCLRDNEFAECLRQFLNMINQRLWHLLYRGWKKYHPYVEIQQQESRYLHYLQALSGGLLNEKDAQEYALTGLLGGQFNGAAGLISSIRHLIGDRKVILKQFQPHWSQRIQLEKLGNHHLVLGDNIALGNKLLSVQQRISIEIGPVSMRFAATLWPNQLHAKRLNHLIRRYLPPHIKYDLIIKIRPEAKRQLQLGAAENYLSWSTWLGTPLRGEYLCHITH